MSRFLFILCVFYALTSCDHPKDDGGSSSKQVSAKLISSKLSSNNLNLASDAVLTNVTGLADSIGLSFSSSNTGNVCGFNIWAADSQTSRSGKEGRSYEEFDLGDPISWTSMGAGMQGECDTATVSQIETYFVYIDLHITVSGERKVVRAYMGQQAPFEAGDLALIDGSMQYWYDKDSELMIASTQARPSNPATFDLSKEVPWYDNNGTEKIILLEFRIEPDKRDYQVSSSTGHVIVDIDFTNSGLSISDTSSDGAILDSIELPFLNTASYSSLLTASITSFENRPEEEEE